MARAHIFNAGPAALPLAVLEKAQAELTDFAGQGMSLMEMSHRSKPFQAVIDGAEGNIRALLGLDDRYKVLFLQGGASLQFAMMPMNLLGGGSADYVLSGAWAEKAFKEANTVGTARAAWDGKDASYMRMPRAEELNLNPDAAYLHITSNETIGGVQFQNFPAGDGAPLIADMSSDIFSRPLPMERFGMIYAGAQKNIGPSGLALVILRGDLAARTNDKLPKFLRYATHIDAGSLYNTPNTWAIYMVKLVTDWILEQGGLAGMAKRNQEKASLLYGLLDGSDFFRPCAEADSRSVMNITWRLADEALEGELIAAAEAEGLKGLKGHRSVGGLRASIYNAVPLESVQALCAFLRDFEAKKG